MVFGFTFFTYNGQRLLRLKKNLIQASNIGERLQWVIKYKTPLTIFSILSGLIGLGSTYFIHPYCFFLLIPVGLISIFYVIPVIPFYLKSPTLRDLPYLKIISIALVWSIIIIWVPFVDTNFGMGLFISLPIALLQNFLFIIAITLPFDIRDIKFDKVDHLKTIPQLIGIKKTILLSEFLICCSLLLLTISEIKSYYYYGLLVGYIITMLLILLTNNKRKELFFAGLIEGTVLILYSCTLIVDCFFHL
jgi:4-hydroxybenzoate polyprenyltransferase